MSRSRSAIITITLFDGKCQNLQMSTFVDFDICHRIMLLRKLHSVTVTYFLKVTNLNRYHSGATCTSKASNPDLPKVVNADSCLKCKSLPSCSCRFAFTTTPAVELLLLLPSCSCRFAFSTTPAVELLLFYFL